jgi:hypothetical protein
MKKLFLLISATLFLLLAASAPVNATTGNDPPAEGLTMSSEVVRLFDRLEEIHAMDVSMLARSERRALRKEVRDIEQNLNAYSGGGVYISVGAAILIVLLLILLL